MYIKSHICLAKNCRTSLSDITFRKVPSEDRKKNFVNPPKRKHARKSEALKEAINGSINKGK